MKKNFRRAGFVSLTLGALGCGEPSQPEPVKGQDLFLKDSVQEDSRKSDGWRKYLDPAELHRAWAPAPDSPWRPYYKPTLVASIATVQSAATPVRNDGMTPADKEVEIFISKFTFGDAVVFIDLVGEQSVLWAAALRKQGLVPVLSINNWPHQFGILHLERPLGALLYYAQEVGASPMPAAARPAFILERARLGQKGLKPAPEQFDNRYFHPATDFPTAAILKAQGVNRIVYVNPRGVTQGCEEDDLSEYFVELWNGGMQFTYVKAGEGNAELALVTPAPRETIFTRTALASYSARPGYHQHYYHSYHHYSYWHDTYWYRSSGAWGGSGSTYSSGGSGSGSSYHSSGGSSGGFSS